jgi:predicted solute-binding protein
MSFPVAMIPYTNMAPYRELGTPAACHFVSLLPRDSIAALCRGRVVAAAVPVGGLAAVAAETDSLGPFGIAATEKSMSVLFFSDRPLGEMDAGTRVHLTPESASSVRLLYLVLGYRNGFDNLPRVVPTGRPANGELLIGDAALKRMWQRRQNGPGALGRSDDVVTDLAGEWYGVHGLPFVFARWVVRKDAPAAARAALEDWLAEFKSRERDLVRRAVPEAACRTGLPEGEIRAYFRMIRRSLETADLDGEARFLSEFETHGAAACPSWAPSDSCGFIRRGRL